MNWKIKSCLCLLLMAGTLSYAQMERYQSKREINGITQQWHTIELPNSIFKDLDESLHGIRIYGITSKNDTIEVPYILQRKSENLKETSVGFNKLNESYRDGRYYYTFEIPSEAPINHMKLNFSDDNFDWKLDLEGSQDQDKWFTLVENYRILSIKNNLTDYQFTHVAIPDAKYRYFRVSMVASKKPTLTNAHFDLQQPEVARYREYPVESFQTIVNKASRKSVVEVVLANKVPVSTLSFEVADSVDYYRPISVSYLLDSLETEQGWMENYRYLTSGTLSSLEETAVTFPDAIAKKLRVEITNDDNTPLTITAAKAKGHVHLLKARFSESADYYLVYGTEDPVQPKYDISLFANDIEDLGPPLRLEGTEDFPKISEQKKGPLFENKAWLWGLILVIIAVLGWFSVKMIRK